VAINNFKFERYMKGGGGVRVLYTYSLKTRMLEHFEKVVCPFSVIFKVLQSGHFLSILTYPLLFTIK